MTNQEVTNQERMLVTMAVFAKEQSYSPYSHFQVGAALSTKEGKIFTGCNIENAAFTPTNCAERTAFFKAISEGYTQFSAIAIVGGRDEFCAPCGVCRQVMAEFCDPETFRVILGKNNLECRKYYLKELLPLGFGKEDFT